MCTYNKRDVQRILKNSEFYFHHKNGSHSIYRNKNGQHLSVNVDDCNRMIMQRLIKQYNLKVG